MERMGEVTAVRGDSVEITFCRPADCEKCGACHGSRAQMQITVKGEAQVGDFAVVDMPASSVVKASALAYVLPLAGLLLGVAVGSLLFPVQESLAGVIGGAIGLAVTLSVVAATEKKRRSDPVWSPKLLRIIPGTEGAKAPSNN